MQGRRAKWVLCLLITGGCGSKASTKEPVANQPGSTARAALPFLATGGDCGVTIYTVDEGSEYMKKLFAHVGERGGAVRGEVDEWSTDDGQRRSEYYLRASSREALESFLRDYVATNALPAGRRFAIELVQGRDTRAPGFARTYLVSAPPVLAGRSVQDAQSSYDDVTSRPVVIATLTPEATKSFGDATTANLGKKLAILVRDTVTSAPIVMSPITGGRLSIAVGGIDPAEAEREANDLAAFLRCDPGATTP